MEKQSIFIGIVIGAVLFGGGSFILLDGGQNPRQEPAQNNSTNNTDLARYTNFTQQDKKRILGPKSANVTTDTSRLLEARELEERHYVRTTNDTVTLYTTSSRTDRLVEYAQGNESFIFKSSRDIAVVAETSNGEKYLIAILPASQSMRS